MTQNKKKIIGLVWIFGILATAFLFSTYGFRFIASNIPFRYEEKIAHFAGDHFSLKKCVGIKDTQSVLALNKLVKRIYPTISGDENISIDVSVIRENDVNAFATLGGKIFINSALLNEAQTPDELAGVLAHEIEHVRHRHILQGALVSLISLKGFEFLLSGGTGSVSPELASTFFNMNFSKGEESEADSDGLLRLEKAHVSALGFYDFFKRLDNKNGSAAKVLFSVISDHPSSTSRAEKVALLMKHQQNITTVLSTEEWSSLKEICD